MHSILHSRKPCPSLPSRVLTPQPAQPHIPQPVLRQHAPHGAAQNLGPTPFLHQVAQADLLQTARPRRVRVVRLLRHLAARHAQVRAVGRHDVVAAVGRRVVGRFVLAHQRERDAAGDAAQG
jgi:hypothetical protein